MDCLSIFIQVSGLKKKLLKVMKYLCYVLAIIISGKLVYHTRLEM